MAFRKIEAGLVHAPVDEFIGKTGTIFYDNDLGDFRISDGVTPGGIALSFGGGGGGNYTLPTASTTTKGGVKIDGTTISISNQVISVGTVPYSKLSGTPTIPSNTNQLTNGAGFITTSALSGYALTSDVPTNTNQLINGAGFITTSALSGYATESYVTSRGYLTSVAWNDITSKPTFATVATSGSYADLTNKPTLFSGSYADLTNKPTLFSGSYTDLTNKPTIPTNTNELTNGAGYITSAALSGYALTTAIPTDISQLTDTQGLLGQGGGGTVIRNVENPYSFSVAGDDSTLREIANGETLRFAGASGITVTSDAEGKITITGPSLVGLATESYVTSQGYITSSALTGYATETYVTTQGYITSAALTGYALTTDIPTDNNQLTNGAGYITSAALTGLASESYVTSRGYITGLSWNDLADKPNLAGTYSWSIAADDSTLREISAGESVKLIGAGGITTSSDAEGNITITGIPVDLTGYATESFVTTRGYITGLSWDQLTNKPNIAGTYTFNIAGTDSTLHQVNSDNTIQFKGTGNIEVTANADGVITIDIPSASVVTDDTAPANPTNGELWWDTVSGNLYIYYDSNWVISNDFTGITDYYQLTGLPDLSVYALRSEITSPQNFTFSVAADDSTLRQILTNESIKFIGAGGITTASDAEGNITITGAAQDRLTSNARSAVLNANGTFSLPTLTAAPSSPQAGQMALADGVSWDPMSQNGGVPYMVIYTGTGWLGMGGVTMDQVYGAILELGTAGI